MTPNRDVLADLDELWPSTPQLEIARKKEELRLRLAFNMVTAREAAGVTQQQVAENVGKSQPWISKLESPNYDHQIETILEYILALGGELSLGFKVGGEVFPILEFEPEVTYQLPVFTEQISRQVPISGDVEDISASTMIITDESSIQDGFQAVA